MAAAQIVGLPWSGEAIEALLPSVAASPWPLEGPGDVLTGAHLFDFTQGASHALLAVRPVRLDGGMRLDVVGLVSDGERLRGAAIEAAAVRIARALDCQALAMCTQRAHVVRACARAGWEITGMVMAKRIGHVQ